MTGLEEERVLGVLATAVVRGGWEMNRGLVVTNRRLIAIHASRYLIRFYMLSAVATSVLLLANVFAHALVLLAVLIVTWVAIFVGREALIRWSIPKVETVRDMDGLRKKYEIKRQEVSRVEWSRSRLSGTAHLTVHLNTGGKFVIALATREYAKASTVLKEFIG